MKRLHTLLTWIAMTIPAMAQWTPTSGPEGATVLAMAADGDTLLASVLPGTIYRRTGMTWEDLGTLNAFQLHAVGGAFVATTHEGIYRSSDRGDSWTKVSPEGTVFSVVEDREILYARIDDTISRSNDGGRTWVLVATPGVTFYTFTVRDSIMLIAASGESPNPHGIFRSADSGRSWQKLESSITNGKVPNRFHSDDRAFYMTFLELGVLRSTDGGVTWHSISALLPKHNGSYPAILDLLTVGDQLWAATPWMTLRFAENLWTTLTAEPSTSFEPLGESVYIGSRSGITITSDRGNTISRVDSGLRATRSTTMARLGSSIFANSDSWIYRTDDDGVSWERTAPIHADILTSSESVMYAAGEFFTDPALYRYTVDSGWSPLTGPLNQRLMFLNTLSAVGDTVYAGFNRTSFDGQLRWLHGGIYRSDDRGESWTAVNIGLPVMDGVVVPVHSIVAHDGIVLAQTVMGLYRSVDHGASWNRIAIVLPGDIQFGRLVAHGERYYLWSYSRVFVSTDRGLTWNEAGSGISPSAGISRVSIVDGVPVAVALEEIEGRQVQVYRLDGEKWTRITDLFPAGVDFHGFIKAGNKVLGSSGWKGIWKGTLGNPSNVAEERDELKALTAYPNPFSNETTLRFRLDQRSDVRITLVTPLGEEIATLGDGELGAGEHHVMLDGREIPSGVFLVRVQIDETITTTVVRKME